MLTMATAGATGAGMPDADLMAMLTQAPPMVVLVVTVFVFLRFIKDREQQAQARDERFLMAMQSMVADVRTMADRSDVVGRQMVDVMGQATEALRRIDHDLEARRP